MQTAWAMPWWTTMVIISAINFIIAIFLFAKSLKAKKLEPENKKYFLVTRTLGIIFVSVAMYRTVFVSNYPDRLAWFDTIFNSPLVIRSLALFAELSFIGIITIILLKLNRDIKNINVGENIKERSFLEKMPFVAAACLILAQFFAYAGLIGQSLTMFAIEETLWAVGFLSITPLVLTRLKELKPYKEIAKRYRVFLTILAVWCFGYLSFQCFFALPFMHYAEIASDIGKSFPSDALQTALFDFTATRDFSTWGGIGFFIWHSGYFTICAWMVLYFMTAPRVISNKTKPS